MATVTDEPFSEEATPTYKVGLKVKIISSYVQRAFGFTDSDIYISCEGTNDKYTNDIWIYSERRNEPIRLLSNEYVVVSN